MLPVYRFKLNGGNDAQRIVFPQWKDDLALEWKMESQQMFHRSELSGNLDFLREDYTYIMSKSFGTVFHLEIEISDGGVSYSSYWKGKFTLTDCKVNVDDSIVTVKPQTEDVYTNILAGLDKEYDLIKLAPEIDKIRLSKRPALQIFDSASETITCVCGNLSFEQDTSLPTENLTNFLREHCHFEMLDSQVQIQMTDYPPGQQAQFAAPFIGTISGDGSTLTNGGAYFIKYRQTDVVAGYIRQLQIISYAQPDDVKWQYEDTVAYADYDFPSDIEFVAQHALDPDLHGDCTDHGLYSRVICNVEEAGPTDTYEIPTDDIVTYNRNYRRCYAYDASSMIYTSQRFSTDPTEWGKDDDGFYYLPPDDTYLYIPIGKNLWGANSVWLRKTNDYINIDSVATYQFTLNDAYPLYSCLQVLLNQIDASIKFEPLSAFSTFLYSGNDPLQGRNNALWLTPKSNITNGEYQTPAQKAPVTLKDIFDMLKNVYKCYWFIERKSVGGIMTTCLRIEHVQFFLNGGAYNASPSVGINLNTMTNKRNGKPWAFGTGVYEYEKIEMPERYQFAWMDEVTDVFKGQPIIVVSEFVEQGRVEEITVANFTSDLDYMMLNPSAVSPDGFALINAYPDMDGFYYVPIITFYVGNWSYRTQNPYLSFHMLQWAYWRYNMPARQLNIEGEVNTASQALSVSRNKKQTVNIPLGLADPNLLALVATSIGNGQIQQMSIRLTSRMAKTQLRYDTE